MKNASAPSSGRGRFGSAAVVLICIGCLVPFAGKAFHIDDPLFLRSAQQIQQHPADPYGFVINWYGYPMSMAETTKNPPLACYYLAAAAALVGWSESALHLALLVPAVGAAWATYRLAASMCQRPLVAALATILTPLFLVSSSNVMCDTLMLCLWLMALLCWRRGWLIAAGILIGFCALSKYFGVSLIPLLLAYTRASRREKSEIRNPKSERNPICENQNPKNQRRFCFWILDFEISFGFRISDFGFSALAAMLIPMAMLAAYQVWTHRLYERSLLVDAAGFALGLRLTFATGWLALPIGLAFTGGCLAVMLFYLPLLWPRRLLLRGVGLAALLALLLAHFDRRDWNWSMVLQAALFILGGLGVVALAVSDLWQRRDADAWLLFFWTAGTLFFALFLNWMINGRSLLPLAPAVGILLARRLDRLYPRRRWWEAVPLAFAAVLALAVTAADCRQANATRAAASAIAESCAGGKLWFEGHWGFQYYLEQLGGEPVDVQDYRFRPGDFLALPANNTGIYPDTAEWTDCVVRREEAGPLFYLTTMDSERGAGFYAHVHGPLPFVFGPAAPVGYRVMQFVPASD